MGNREEEEEDFLPPSESGRSPDTAVKAFDEPVTWRSLPNKTQLFLLALCRLSEPLSNTCLLPYIYYLLESILSSHDNKEDIARLSGFLVAAFPLAQFPTSILWGWISDRHGRKPVVVIGLFVSIVANFGFGFSRSYRALFFWRVLAGLGNGNIGVMRTMTAEIVKERRYQTRAFLILPLIFNSGRVAGLALGGCLANPAVNLSWLFGPTGLLNIGKYPQGVGWVVAYPYALPSICNSAVLGLSLFLAVFGMKETLIGKEERDIGRRIGDLLFIRFLKRVFRKHSSDYELLDADECSESTPFVAAFAAASKPDGQSTRSPPRPRFLKIWTSQMIITLVSFGLLPLHNAAFMHTFPVFLSTPPNDNTKATILFFTGGLGLSSSSIGLWLAFFGVCGIFLQLFIYPRMQARIGTLGCFRVSLFIFPFAYLLAPYLSLLSHSGFERWPCVAIIICAQVMARTIAIPSTVILLTNAAPSKNTLGTVHGAGTMLSSLARAIGSAAGGAVFTWGMHTGFIGAVWWLYLMVIAIVALLWSFLMKDVDQSGSNCPEKAPSIEETDEEKQYILAKTN